ncbi:hypothetical protein MMC26_000050 [Xylographa opegraphella]|nr:hypothetical protein [Xylographa opegraphella]
MDHQSREVTRRRPLDLDSQGFGLPGFHVPWGIRTPNGLVWAHDLDDLYDVRPLGDRFDPIYWSISMVRVFEFVSNDIPQTINTKRRPAHIDGWEVSPRKPWPLLNFPETIPSVQSMGFAEEDFDYCRQLHHTPWELKSSYSDEDYHVPNLSKSKKSGSIECFCGHCGDPRLRIPTNSQDCAKHHFDLHCNCPNRGELMKKSKSLPDICSVVNHWESNESSTSKFSQSQQQQRTKECVDAETIPYSSEISTINRMPPKLEEFIPDEFLPDILIVNDDDDCATGEQGLREKNESVEDRIGEGKSQRRYHRVRPITTHKGNPPEHELRTGYLNLSRANLCGTGHHASVYRASFLPPPPLTTNHRSLTGDVTVIAKTSFPSEKHRGHLENEAEILGKLSTKARRHMQQDWCGFNLVPGLERPVPVGAVVPKFYGYYKPEGPTEAAERLSPILLVEDCGVPVQAESLSEANKEEIYSLFLRLHRASIVQNSPYTRNILTQPGPLTRPPSERSSATPSFRIIDFGRAHHYSQYIDPQSVAVEPWRAGFERRFAASCAANESELKNDLELILEW